MRRRYAGRNRQEAAIDAIEEYSGDFASLTAADLIRLGRPVVLRGLAAGWPAVKAADKGAYLKRFDNGIRTDMIVAEPEHDGRLFYTGAMEALTFTRQPATVSAVLDRIAAAERMPEPETVAAQAVVAADSLPGFAEENDLTLFDAPVGPRVWIGNRVVTATHHDMQSNVAVVMAGRRRFTLFPPDQVANLYIGPIEFTPAGTPVSLFDPEAPDLERFPRAVEAMATARAAELEPGDALYIPHMWWHHVRSLDPLSVLVNYWWDEAGPPQPGLAPIDAMVHAILAFEGLPQEQRAAWRAMFGQFVFADPEDAIGHIPEARRGIRGRLSPESKARIRKQLGQMMGR